MKMIIIIIALFLTVSNCFAYDNYWDGGKIWDATYFLGGGLIGIYAYEITDNYFESVLIASSLSFVKEFLDELYYRNVIHHNKIFNSFFDPYNGFSGRDVLICGAGAAILTIPMCYLKKKSYMALSLTKKKVYIAWQYQF